MTPSQRPGDARRFLVLKVGGALFSDKGSTNSLKLDVLDWYADMISRSYGEVAGRLVLITGGGSFGHGAVRDAEGVADRMLALTDAVFALKTHWAAALRRQHVPVLPMQIAGFAELGARGGLISRGNPVRQALARGILPILSGDIVFKAPRTTEVFGSDRVPLLCSELGCTPLRVVMLTDKPGILSDGEEGIRPIRHIDPRHPQRAFSAIWKEDEADVTAGMRGKLASLLVLAERGIECIVAEGRPGHASFAGIAELADGRRFGFPHTRIALADKAR